MPSKRFLWFLCSRRALSKNGMKLENVREQTAEMCGAAFKQNVLAIEFIPGELQTREMCLHASTATLYNIYGNQLPRCMRLHRTDTLSRLRKSEIFEYYSFLNYMQNELRYCAR